MKNDDLFELIGEIGERHIEGAKKRKTVWKKWAAMAACLCIVVAAAFAVTLRVPDGYKDGAGEPDHRENDYISENGHMLQNYKTSETYGSLEELLLHLSGNDYHGRTLDSNGGGGSAASEGANVTHGAKAVAYNGFAYYIGEDNVKISEINGSGDKAFAPIDFAASELFLCGDNLVLKGGRTVGDELNYDSYSIVRTYSLADPAKPVLMDEYEQKGEFVDCYMAGEELYLLTSDGVCACGYSRLSDLSEYEPSLKINGEEESWNDWNDNAISILGEPTSVNYVAVSVFDAAAGKITGKRAFYGDIDNVFFGEDWFAAVIQSRTDEILTQPEIYTFDGSLSYTGKIELASMAGVDKNIELNEDAIAEGIRLDITAVVKKGDVFGVIGCSTQQISDDTEIIGYRVDRKIFAAAKNTGTGEGEFEFVDVEADMCSIDDVFHEENREIICVSTLYDADDPDDATNGNRFIIVEFEGTEISMFLADFITDEVSGVENYYALGNPYGSLETLIPLENGIYLRYNGVPNGFDIFDFSGSALSNLLYRSDGEIAEDERFDFTWKVLGENVFGVMHMKMGEGGEIRETVFSWRIYSVDITSDTPFTLLKEYTFGEGDSFLSSSLGFAVFEYDGEFYCVTKTGDSVMKLEW